jgi:hypothetical protein
MVHQPQLYLQRQQTPPLPLSLRLMTHPCCQQCLCECPQTFLTLQCPLPCAYGRRMLTYLSALPGKQSSMCMPTLHQSSASIPQQIALFFLLFLFLVLGGRAIHYTYMDMQRKKPQVSNGRPSTAEAASYPHYLGRGRHKSLFGLKPGSFGTFIS